MKLSIIIPTKNEEKHLPKLLASIKKQSFKDYEIIVADNNSKDKTREIAKSYECKIVKGGLPGKGRNAGAKAAKGEIILFLDADTELKTENFLEKAIAEFGRRKLDAAAPTAYLKGKKMDKLFIGWWNCLIGLSQYSSTPFAGGWCIFVKKNVHQSIKGFDEEIVLGEDSEYIQRVATDKPFKAKFRILKSVKIQMSTRRLDKEGHFKIAVQGFGSGIHWALLGVDKKNKFRYRFDIYEK